MAEKETLTQQELAAKIDTTDWFTLRAHLERGGLIVVDPILDLAEVGFAVAADNVSVIERWIASGLLSKPTVEQVADWDGQKAKAFLCLIVSPYVLIQENSGHQI